MMKLRKIIIICSVTIFCFFCGCKSLNQEEKIAQQDIEQQGEIIIESIINKDIDSLKQVFCSKIQNEENIYNKISEGIGFICGDIVSYDVLQVSEDGWKSESGEIVEKEFSGRIENIKTDMGKTYLIAYGYFSVNKKHPNYVGVFSLSIYDIDTYIEGKGYPDYGRYDIGLVE